MIDLSKLKRLWSNDRSIAENTHSLVLFRRHFTVDSTVSDGELLIAADSDFIVTLDGIELDRGQYSDDPLRKSFTAVKLPVLTPGEHLLAVKVYYIGSDFSTYSPGLPGLYIALHGKDFYLEGDAEFKTLADPAFQHGAGAKITPQLGFCTFYDQQKEIAWSDPALDDSAWDRAKVLERAADCLTCMRPATPRPVMRDFVPAKLHACGVRAKSPVDVSNLNAAEKMSLACCYRSTETPEIPCVLKHQPHYGPVSGGLWAIADLGYEETGFVEFELDAPAGTVIYYAHGEHIDDGHVRTDLYTRAFADTVIWKGGRQSFQLPFRRVGARYLELHIEFPNGGYSVELFRVGVVPWRVTLPEPGAFDCSDEKLNILHRNSLHSLELCMHDHYEDCPWREQSLYTYDSRWQMIYGYYTWGNYDFAAASMALFAPGQDEEGHLRICAPARGKTQIPVFTFVWLNAVYEQYFYSGSRKLFDSCRNCADRIKDLIYSRFDAASGLMKEDSNKWLFCEWRDELDGHSEFDRQGFSSLYNIYAAAALEAYALMADDNAVMEFVQKLKKRIHEYFYQPDSGLYASRVIDGKVAGHYHEHTQALMLVYDVAPQEIRKELAEKVCNFTYGISGSLSSLYLSVKALEKCGIEGKRIFDKIITTYEPMLKNNTGTLWETAGGGFDFGYAGSLCHGWSALPVYIAKALMLGVKPLQAGWKQVEIAPDCCGLDFANGAVPTPYGKVEVSWQASNNQIKQLTVRSPHEIACKINCPGAEIKFEEF